MATGRESLSRIGYAPEHGIASAPRTAPPFSARRAPFSSGIAEGSDSNPFQSGKLWTRPWLGLGSLQTVNNIVSYKTPSALECWPRTLAWRPRLSSSEGASLVCGFPLGPGVWAPLPVLSLGEPQPPGMEMRVEMLSFVR